MNKTQIKGVALLLTTALIWGSAFVAQSMGMESVGAFTFSGVRMLLGAVVLAPIVFIRNRRQTQSSATATHEKNHKTIRYGIILGVVFCLASNIQQCAFYYSTPGKIAFITALYIFFVPLFGLLAGKRLSWLTWVCVAGGFVGLYFLCIDPQEAGALNKGDVLSLLCAAFFALHILLIEKFVAHADGVKLSCLQFAVAGAISCVLMFLFETPQIAAIKSAALPLLYSGVMSCGVAYTFQIIGQKYTEATLASLLLCMESVFAVLAAAVILHELLSGREIIGCTIMFASIILSQFSGLITSPRPKKNNLP